MSLVNFTAREITCKIVYYGPGRSGKTTNLQYVYGRVPESRRGRMVSLATQTATSVGAQYFSKTEEFFGITGNGFATPASQTINGTPVARSAVTYTYEENKSMGMYVQEQVGFNERIFLTGALRFDANSTFGEEFDPLIYPKFSGTWVVSEEPFFNLDFVDEFRLRGAWRWIYTGGAVLSLYLNVFVLIVQAFQKIPTLNVFAPTGSEPPFAVTQVIVLLAFIAFGLFGVRRFRPVST